FSTQYQVGSSIGPHRLTVRAENSGGTGSATVEFTNLPSAINARFSAEGGAATFGQLRSGLSWDRCTLAVYERGAIALLAGNGTRVVRNAVFDKWLAVRDATGAQVLGCPRDEVRAIAANTVYQSFDHGYVYAAPTGAFWVPPVFWNKIVITQEPPE